MSSPWYWRLRPRSAGAIAWASSSTVLVLSGLALIGWLRDLLLVKGAEVHWFSMSPITAACLIVTSGGLIRLLRSSPQPGRLKLAALPGLVVSLLSALSLVLYVVARRRDRAGSSAAVPWLNLSWSPALHSVPWSSTAQTAVLTAIFFLMTGCALVLLAQGSRRAANVAHALLLPGAVASYLVPVYCLYHVQAVQQWLDVPAALTTGLAFCALCVALFCVRPDTWLMDTLTGEQAGSVMARRFLLPVALVPLALDMVLLVGQSAGFYTEHGTAAAHAVLVVFFFLCLVWLNASSLNRADAKRRQAEEQIRTLNAELEERVRHRTAELEASNAELEAVCYSIAHDLRTPLRGIDGFSQVLLEDCGAQLGCEGQDYLRRVRCACQTMSQLIDDLLGLSQLTRTTMHRQTVNLTALGRLVAQELRQDAPDRHVDFRIAEDLTALGDRNLLWVVLRHLLENAWKFTVHRAQAVIELGRTFAAVPRENSPAQPAFFVRDNGCGFDMAYADKLFTPFQRLHANSDFPGTGIGLATIQRAIHRHGGRIWAQAAVDQGATFYFTLDKLETGAAA